jgi:2-oxoglutarate ferredoxin oxidoreductase subunit alpha
MNDWMIPKLEWDDSYVPDRGKVLSADELEEIEQFYRYLDVDGDHIASRTLPGVHPKGAYFTRGSGHDKYGKYTEDDEAYQEVVDRIRKKVESAGDAVPAPDVFTVEGGASVGIISVGGCHWSVLEARDDMLAHGLDVDYLRVKGFPFNQTVEDFLDAHETVFVIEQNRDAQLKTLLTLETGCAKEKLVSILYYGGQPLSKGHVLEGIMPHMEGITAEVGS